MAGVDQGDELPPRIQMVVGIPLMGGEKMARGIVIPVDMGLLPIGVVEEPASA